MSDPQSPQLVVEYANPFQSGQPLDSRTVFERHEDGVSYTFLPEGLDGAAFALVVLGLLSITCLATVLLAIAAVPLVMLWVATYRGASRPTVLSIRGGRVTLFSGAALFRPVKSWVVEDVVSVGVVTSGVSMNLRVTGDLRMRLKRYGVTLITGRDRADLEWVASGVRAALGKREWTE